MGFQAINGKSLITFPKNIKTSEFIRYLIKIRSINVTNSNLKKFTP